MTSGVFQITGYIVAATGPVLVGHVHDASGGWTMPFAVIGAGTIVMTVCGIIAARDTSTPPERSRQATIYI